MPVYFHFSLLAVRRAADDPGSIPDLLCPSLGLGLSGFDSRVVLFDMPSINSFDVKEWFSIAPSYSSYLTPNPVVLLSRELPVECS